MPKGKEVEIQQADLPHLFNEWLRRYTENPSLFEAEFQTVTRFLAEKTVGEEPTYGETCTAYLVKINGELLGQDVPSERIPILPGPPKR